MDVPAEAPSARPAPRRSLVIPMFREQDRIPATLELLAGSVLDAPDTELLLVDDGSDDDTVAVARQKATDLGLCLEVLAEPHRGKGAAVRAGVRRSTGRSVVFTDADLSTGVDDVAACFDAVEGGATVVVATRTHPDSRVHTRGSTARKLSGWTYNSALRALGLTHLRDTQCGLKGFECTVAHRLFDDLKIEGFAFDIEVLARAERLGVTIQELPVTWSHVPASRVHIARDAPRMFADAVRVRRLLRNERGDGGEPIEVRDGETDAAVPLVGELTHP
jgi:glycosyltransferase involved in cell wall biosynthesis